MKSRHLLLWLTSLLSGLVFIAPVAHGQLLLSGQNSPTLNDKTTQQQSFTEYLGVLRNNQLSGSVDPADVLKARADIKQRSHTKNSSSLGLQWTEVGPDNFGGRTRSILVDKNNPSVLYAGNVAGGVWRSTTAGSSWSLTQVKIGGNTVDALLNVSCMAQAPDGSIYAGTGESFYTGTGTGNGGLLGKGVFKSTDGVVFSLLPNTALSIPNVTTADWAYVNKLAVSPGGRVYAATNTGLKYSDDGGDTWSLAKSNSVDITGNTTDVKIGSNGIVVASAGNDCMISETGDPNAFADVSDGTTGHLPMGVSIGRIEFAIAPGNPDVIYASAAGGTGSLFGIYKSVDKGQNWQVVGPGGSIYFNIFSSSTTSVATGNGLYDNVISVYPNDPDQILVGGVNMWRGHKVDNGYYAWDQLSNGSFPFWSLYVHFNHHAYTFHPNNNQVFYVASDGGISVTTDNGNSFQDLNGNYKTTLCNSVAASFDGQVVIGTRDNGSLVITKQGNTVQAADAIYNGDGGKCAVSFLNPKVFFVSSPGSNAVRSVDNGANFSSFNGNMGTTTGGAVTPILLWESFSDPFSTDSVMFVPADTIHPGDSFIVKSATASYPFIEVNNTAFVIYPHDTLYFNDPVGSKFFLGQNGSVWMTKRALDFTNTPTWFNLGSFSGIVQSMAVSKDGDNLLVGTQDGLLLRFMHLGSYVSATNNNMTVDTAHIFTGRAITSINFDYQNADNVIVTLGNYGNASYVYYSNNALSGAVTFNSKQGNLPLMPVYSSIIEMSVSNRVILGTEMGIWTTDDITAGSTVWTPETNGMSELPVYQIIQQTQNHWPILIDNDSLMSNNWGMIYAATYGRGVFLCDKFVGIEQPVNPSSHWTSTLQVYPNPAVGNANVAYLLDKNANVTFQVINITGKVVKTITFNTQSAGNHQFQLNLEGLTKGAYMLQMSTAKKVNTQKLIVM